MKTHVRILLVAAALALVAGYVGLRRGNTALSVRAGFGAPAEGR